MRFYVIQVLLLTFFIQARALAQDLGSINKLKITKEEVQREMRQYRSAIVMRAAKNNQSVQGNFWNKPGKNGVKPLDLLRQTALDSLTKIKVQEQLLRERKLWPYATYQDFLRDLEKTNALRKQAGANKQAMVGPEQYTEQLLFDYRFTNALIQLKQQLVAEKIITVSEEDLAKQFEKMQQTVYKEEKYTLKNFTRQVKDAYVEQAYAALIKKYVKDAQVKVNQSALQTIQLN